MNTSIMNTSIQIRIVKAPKSNDGWITKDIANGKVGFIANLDDTVQLLRPGQIWNAKIAEEHDKYNLVRLLSLTLMANSNSN